MDWETDFSSDTDYDEFADEIPYVGNILEPFQFYPVFTAAKIQDFKNLAGTSASDLWPPFMSHILVRSQLTTWPVFLPSLIKYMILIVIVVNKIILGITQ